MNHPNYDKDQWGRCNIIFVFSELVAMQGDDQDCCFYGYIHYMEQYKEYFKRFKRMSSKEVRTQRALGSLCLPHHGLPMRGKLLEVWARK